MTCLKRWRTESTPSQALLVTQFVKDSEISIDEQDAVGWKARNCWSLIVSQWHVCHHVLDSLEGVHESVMCIAKWAVKKQRHLRWCMTSRLSSDEPFWMVKFVIQELSSPIEKFHTEQLKTLETCSLAIVVIDFHSGSYGNWNHWFPNHTPQPHIPEASIKGGFLEEIVEKVNAVSMLWQTGSISRF